MLHFTKVVFCSFHRQYMNLLHDFILLNALYWVCLLVIGHHGRCKTASKRSCGIPRCGYSLALLFGIIVFLTGIHKMCSTNSYFYLQKIDKMYAAFTGQPLERVQKFTDRDHFFSAAEVLYWCEAILLSDLWIWPKQILRGVGISKDEGKFTCIRSWILASKSSRLRVNVLSMLMVDSSWRFGWWMYLCVQAMEFGLIDGLLETEY